MRIILKYLYNLQYISSVLGTRDLKLTKFCPITYEIMEKYSVLSDDVMSTHNKRLLLMRPAKETIITYSRGFTFDLN